jgi:hypothetical protein
VSHYGPLQRAWRSEAFLRRAAEPIVSPLRHVMRTHPNPFAFGWAASRPPPILDLRFATGWQNLLMELH